MDNLARDTLKMLQKQRSFWVVIEGYDFSVQFRRPPEASLPELMGGVRAEHVVRLAADWKDVTPSKLVGAAGGSDALEFDREVWGEWVTDRIEVLQLCTKAIAEKITAHLESRGKLGNA